MINKKYFILCGCLMAVPAWSADINFRGFASFTGGTTLSSDEEIDGYTEKFDFRPDSLIALQMDAKLDDKLSATMQLLSKGSAQYEADIEWAYMTYKFNDNLQVSAGRIRIPFYRYSDFIDVRYAYNWLKAPKGVYDFEFSGYDGLSLIYDKQLGSWDSSLQVIVGQFDGDANGTPATLEDIVGLSWTLNRDWLTLRAGYISSTADIVVPELNGLAQLVAGIGAGAGVDLSDVASKIVIDGDKGNYISFALGIDYNNMLLDSEYIQYSVEENLTADTSAYYVTVGYRFNTLIPYATYSNLTSDPEDKISGLIPESLASAPIAELGGATLPQALAGAVAATEADTSVIEFGLRYDFHHSAALKWSILQQEDIAGEKQKLFRFGIDLVF